MPYKPRHVHRQRESAFARVPPEYRQAPHVEPAKTTPPTSRDRTRPRTGVRLVIRPVGTNGAHPCLLAPAKLGSKSASSSGDARLDLRKIREPCRLAARAASASPKLRRLRARS